jgi:hypothetical protein
MKSPFTGSYSVFLRTIVARPKVAGPTQQQLAQRLIARAPGASPQAIIAKLDGAEARG